MRLFLTAILVAGALCAQALAPFRPPAVPLVTHDPYFSIWSMADQLTDAQTKHWTGTDHQLAGFLRVDGKPYRFMGSGGRNSPEAMRQTSLDVLPTRTIYRFDAAGVQLTLTFFTPSFPQDLDLLSRPVTYVSFECQASDQKAHDVALYFDASGWIAANTPEQLLTTSHHRINGLDVMRVGTAEQPVLQKSGDNLRIDWGYLYVAAPQAAQANMVIQPTSAREPWLRTGNTPQEDDLEPTPYTQRYQPRLITTFALGQVSTSPVSRRVLLAYDDLFGLQYFHRNLRPWWRRNGMGIADLLRKADAEYPALLERGRAFDDKLMADLRQKGGEKYARLAALAFRQTLAAHKLVADIDGTPLYMSKENFSNGSINTVDLFYPSAPFFLYLNPELLRAEMTPLFEYAQMKRWPWPYSPHDLGTYPLANGQTYGGGERSEENQMPVEESGNMLILTAALAKKDGNANYALRYWPLLQKWAAYLRDKGFDPENQLSTDDFAGHLAHNTNLSIKAILALASYGMLSDMAGKKAEAAEYKKLSQGMAQKWMQMADDGDHYRLAFDKPGTWSQKYNLVWDRLLGLNVFPKEIARKEIEFYKTKQNRYGLPLDNRETYTKLDWIVWTATLAESRSDWDALIDPVYAFLQETPTRVPMTDWYWTLDGKQRGFQARSVVGGVYIKMLE